MSLEDIQKDVDLWTMSFDPQYWLPLEILARLTEETGELAREVNHLYGPKKKKDSEPENSIGAEISDILFTLCCMANREGINLQEEWNKLMRDKQYGRDNERYNRVNQVQDF
jgi:NTP pyrophosphatase (non-canonical NTP hydrolase)